MVCWDDKKQFYDVTINSEKQCDGNKARKGDWSQAEHVSTMISNKEVDLIGNSKTARAFFFFNFGRVD